MKLKEQLINMGLSEAQAQKVIDEVINGQYIPKSRFNEVNEENKSLKQTVADRDKQLKELGKLSGDNKELSEKITQLREENEKAAAEYAETVKGLKIDNAVESAIRDAKGKNIKAVKALLEIDSSKITVNEKGELVGLDIKGQLEKLKGAEDSFFLFSGSSGFRGTQPERSSGSDPDVFPEKGSYEDMAAWFEAHAENN